MVEHFAVSQPFWLLVLVCPHGQRYLSKRSPLGEGLGGDSQRDQGIRLTLRWETFQGRSNQWAVVVGGAPFFIAASNSMLA